MDNIFYGQNFYEQILISAKCLIKMAKNWRRPQWSGGGSGETAQEENAAAQGWDPKPRCEIQAWQGPFVTPVPGGTGRRRPELTGSRVNEKFYSINKKENDWARSPALISGFHGHIHTHSCTCKCTYKHIGRHKLCTQIKQSQKL